MTRPEGASRIDTTVAHSARRYNYWLGGKDHFGADRESGDRIAAAYPQVVMDARANRAWMRRVVRYLAGEQGVRQFIDFGVGLPVEPNLHEIVQGINPTSRIMYVDNDLLVMVHARALLQSAPQGATAYAEVDMHDTVKVLAEAKDLLDFDQPIAVLYCAVLYFVEEDQQAYDLVARSLNGLAAGSYIAISNFTLDGVSSWRRRKIAELIEKQPRDGQIRPRTRKEFARFFDGLYLVGPGIRLVSDWRLDLAEDSDSKSPPSAHVYGAVARKVG
jgi:hypothetical protein